MANDQERRRWLCVFLPTLVALCLAPGASAQVHRDSGPERLRAGVLEVRPHDPEAFTQGLELAGGRLYESTGQYGRSELRVVDPATGEPRRSVPLPDELFGEGLTVVGDAIWQLTWREGIALHRDRATLAETDRASYQGEGWGICADGSRLIMSDGSDRLTFRNAGTFAVTGHVKVRNGGSPVSGLNELECVNGTVFANVLNEDHLLRIDPATGAVTAIVDASELGQDPSNTGVLNGIAALGHRGQFLLTGKNWSHTYRVRFVPASHL
ncbi:MAG: glutaminyl-peptide cyclotransferase [Pseudonocardiaceae bacterium]|nr:glutaminyl-peptide cyclotransferase [Pseudonocardiaceae bacterium]